MKKNTCIDVAAGKDEGKRRRAHAFTGVARLVASLALVLWLLPHTSLAVELASRITSWEPVYGGGREPRGDLWLAKIDTDAGNFARTNPLPREGGVLGHMATGPDGSMYVVNFSQVSADEGPVILGKWRRIWRLPPSLEPDGQIVYRDVEVVFERYRDEGETDAIVSNMRQLATRSTGVARDHRLYFSVACGACGDGQIYYVDDSGEAVLYYTVALEHMAVPSCGMGGSWGGDFAFGDDGHLYLTSGGQRPAALYRVPDVGLDPIPEDVHPEFVWEGCCPMHDFEVIGQDVYFTNDTHVFRLDLRELGIAEDVFTHPDIIIITDIDRWTRDDARYEIMFPIPDREREGREPPDPDLEVARIEIGDPVFEDRGRTSKLPVRVTVENTGGNAREDVNVVVFVTYERGGKAVEAPFSVAHEKNRRSPSTAGLRAGAQLAFAGTITLRHPEGDSLRNKEVSINASVDSCREKESPESHCRVEESDESNNDRDVEVTLSTSK